MSDERVEILLVEDNPGDEKLTLIALRLTQLVNQVFVVRNGEEALDFLFCRGSFSHRSFNHPPQLVLLDLKLPKVDGLNVLKEIKTDARTRAIPVVILSSSKVERDLVQAYRLGANGYMQKPVDFNQFHDKVTKLAQFWLRVNESPPENTFSAE